MVKITNKELEWLSRYGTASAQKKRNLEIFLKARDSVKVSELCEHYEISESRIRQIIEKMSNLLEKIRFNPRLLHEEPKETNFSSPYRKRICTIALLGIPDDLVKLVVDRALVDMY